MECPCHPTHHLWGYCCLSSCSARFLHVIHDFLQARIHSSREGDLYLGYFSKNQHYSKWTNLLQEVLVLSTAHKRPFSYILPGIQCFFNSSGGFERGESPNSCYFQPLRPKALLHDLLYPLQSSLVTRRGNFGLPGSGKPPTFLWFVVEYVYVSIE